MGGYRSGYRSGWLEKNLAKKKTPANTVQNSVSWVFFGWMSLDWQVPNLETRRCQIWKLGPRYWACGRAAAKYGNYERACGLGPQEGIPATLAICPSAGRGREAPRVTDVSLADRLPALPTAFPCSRTLSRTRCI